MNGHGSSAIETHLNDRLIKVEWMECNVTVMK